MKTSISALRASEPAPPAIDSGHFRKVLGHYPTGVTVVTAMGRDGRPAGMAVGSFTSVSLDPLLVAFYPDQGSNTFRKIQAAGSFCVNVLAHDQEALCRGFAGKADDKFAGVAWRPAPSGAPIVSGALAWIDCGIDAIHVAGDHYIVIGRVGAMDIHAADPSAGSATRPASLPLVFFQGKYGHFAALPGENDRAA